MFYIIVPLNNQPTKAIRLPTSQLVQEENPRNIII